MARVYRRLAIAALLLVGTVGVQVAATVPASAAAELEVRGGISASNADDVKSATAVCPDNTRILGGGGWVTGDTGGLVHLTRLQALGSSDTFIVEATERAPHDGDWAVIAYGFCGPAPAGLEYVSFSNASGSVSPTAATAACTGSRRLISTGARIVGGAGQVVLDETYPLSTSSVRSTAYEVEGGYGGGWTLWSYGVCANPLPGLEIRTADSLPADSTNESLIQDCGSKRLFGVGGQLNGGLGHVQLTALFPWGHPDYTQLSAIEQPGGYASNWYSRLYAFCAT